MPGFPVDDHIYVILYFDPSVFVLALWLTPSQNSLNRILQFNNLYPYPMKLNCLPL